MGSPSVTSAAVALVAWLIVSPDAAGQGTQPASPAPPSQGGGAGDFLTHAPRGAIGGRIGWQVPTAGSDIYDFFVEQLTIEKSDFAAVPLGLELGIDVSSRLQVLAEFDISHVKIASEYRDWVDNNRQPIEQRTSMERISVSGSMKIALLPRGVQVSGLAWVPRTVVPYVGAGAGAIRYSLSQTGDFVDFETLEVFPDEYVSFGWAPMGQVFGGVDIRVWRMLFLNLDARYQWAKADLGPDFVGFAPIDLSAFTALVGAAWVF